jgi:hypothetical protein
MLVKCPPIWYQSVLEYGGAHSEAMEVGQLNQFSTVLQTLKDAVAAGYLDAELP